MQLVRRRLSSKGDVTAGEGPRTNADLGTEEDMESVTQLLAMCRVL
jgi:hypothetical protein